MKVETVVSWLHDRRHNLLQWGGAFTAVLLLTLWLLRNWLIPTFLPGILGDAALPTSARREVLTEMALVWMFKQELLQGHMLSEWNPYWFSGFAWLRFLSYPTYYAIAGASIWLRLSLPQAMVAFYVLVMAGSGLAMFGFLRRVVSDWRAALFGALAYQAFPYHNHVGVETWVHAAFWMVLPLALWAIECGAQPNLTRGRRVNRLIVTGIILALFLIISSEYAIIAGPFAALYLGAHELRAVRRGERSLLQAGADYVLVGVIAAGLSAFLLVPGYLEVKLVGIHAKHAGGSTFGDELIRNYAVTPQLVWYAIVRRLGFPRSLEGLPSIASSFWSITWYPGLVIAPLTLLGMARLRRFTVLLATWGLLLAILFVGGPTLAINPFSYLPVIGRLSPFRGMMLVVVFATILAAHGFQIVLESLPWFVRIWRRLTHRQLSLPGWLKQTARWLLFAGITALMLLDFAPSVGAYQTTPSYFKEDDLKAYAWIAQQAHDARLWEIASLPRDQYLRTVSLDELPLRRYAGYYDNGAPLYTWQATAWMDLATVLHLHQVRYVLLDSAENGISEIQASLQVSGFDPAFESGTTQIWENPGNAYYARFYDVVALDIADDFFLTFDVLPKLVARDVALVAGDATSDLEAYDFLLTEEPVLRDGQVELPLPRSLEHRLVTRYSVELLSAAAPTEAWVWPERLGWDNVYVEVQTDRPGVLTLAESWYPHWRVEVNGEPAQVLRVNWSLLGVRLEPGTHRVRFYFQRPWYVYVGFGISLLTLLGIIFWCTGYVTRRLRLPHIQVSDAYLRSLAEPEKEQRIDQSH